MRRSVQLLAFASLILVFALVGQGMEIGAKVATQTPSLVLQAEWDVSPNLTMGVFVVPPLEALISPGTVQTPPLTIGLMAKYRFTYIHPAFVPYLGVAGSLTLQGTETTIGMDVLVGASLYLGRDFHLFAEAAFSVFPPPDVATWYDVTGWYKGLYLGFGFRL